MSDDTDTEYVLNRLREQRLVLLREPRGGVTLDRDDLVVLLADASDAIMRSITRQLRPPREVTLDEADLQHWWEVVNQGELRRYPIGTLERLVAALIEAVRFRPTRERHKDIHESRHRWIDAVRGALGQRWNGSVVDAQEQLTELGIYAAGMLEAGEELHAEFEGMADEHDLMPCTGECKWCVVVKGFRELQEQIKEKQRG